MDILEIYILWSLCILSAISALLSNIAYSHITEKIKKSVANFVKYVLVIDILAILSYFISFYFNTLPDFVKILLDIAILFIEIRMLNTTTDIAMVITTEEKNGTK